LLWAFPHLAAAQVAILRIQVMEGEGAVNAPGSRAAHPLAVQVTDETGQPVEGAAVSFHLPEEGPGGTFGNGLRTEVAITDARGRVTLRTLQLNRTPGRFAIRIVASKEQARAGMVTFQYIAEAAGSTRVSRNTPAASRSAPRASHRVLKWVALAVLAGAAATAGAVLAGKSSGATSSSAASAATATTASGIAIGAPSLTVGKP
jgi:hypothetical protein